MVSIPLSLIGNFFQQLYNTVDSMVGNFVNTNALAAVGRPRR